MLRYSIHFPIIGLVAEALGFSGVMGAATNIAWILFVVAAILFVVGSVLRDRDLFV